jgi:hypothetical protein
MNAKVYTEKAGKRLAHVKSHLDGGFRDIEGTVQNIVQGRGDPMACALDLSRHALASAIFAWFGNHDLNAMKQWFFVAGKLDQLYYQMQENDPEWGRGFPKLFKPLLSDHNALIDWFAHYDLAYDMKRVENHKTHDFWAYQAIVAIRGDWPRLIERCERIIADPPGASKEQKYLVDHHFYLALAKGDIEKMQSALQEIVSPKAIQARLDYESGYTADLISTPAVIYAKIAWRHGYKVKVDSPYVPQEWLPNEPLKQYDNHYGFFKS